MEGFGYFVTGAVRPFFLLLFWVPLMATVLWLIRRYAPRHERWLFYRITWRTTYQVVRRALNRRGRATFLPRVSRPKDPW
jgi:hypothetical protein